jgi:hypothetical protein
MKVPKSLDGIVESRLLESGNLEEKIQKRGPFSRLFFSVNSYITHVVDHASQKNEHVKQLLEKAYIYRVIGTLRGRDQELFCEKYNLAHPTSNLSPTQITLGNCVFGLAIAGLNFGAGYIAGKPAISYEPAHITQMGVQGYFYLASLVSLAWLPIRTGYTLSTKRGIMPLSVESAIVNGFDTSYRGVRHIVSNINREERYSASDTPEQRS